MESKSRAHLMMLLMIIIILLLSTKTTAAVGMNDDHVKPEDAGKGDAMADLLQRAREIRYVIQMQSESSSINTTTATSMTLMK